MPELTLTAAELTSLHGETLAEMRLDRTLANIGRRAETLWTDGYTARLACTGLYLVTAPKNAEGVVSTYVVRLSDLPERFPSTCTCPCFQKLETCKHLQALLLAVEDPQAAAHDAEAAERFDVDVYEFANFCGEGRN